MLSWQEITRLIQSLIWLLAGVGIFVVGMHFVDDALEKSAGSDMKTVLIDGHVARLAEGNCSIGVSPMGSRKEYE